MKDADQSRRLHLRKIPRTIGDIPDGPSVHFKDNHDGQPTCGGTIIDARCKRTPELASDQAGRRTAQLPGGSLRRTLLAVAEAFCRPDWGSERGSARVAWGHPGAD